MSTHFRYIIKVIYIACSVIFQTKKYRPVKHATQRGTISGWIGCYFPAFFSYFLFLTSVACIAGVPTKVGRRGRGEGKEPLPLPFRPTFVGTPTMSAITSDAHLVSAPALYKNNVSRDVHPTDTQHEGEGICWYSCDFFVFSVLYVYVYFSVFVVSFSFSWHVERGLLHKMCKLYLFWAHLTSGITISLHSILIQITKIEIAKDICEITMM